MGHSLNIEHGDYGSVIMRQLLHGRVQFFLELADGNFLCGVAFAGRLDEIRVVFDAAVRIVQARMLPPISLLEEVDRHIDGDGMHPRIETGFSPEAAN